MNDARACAEAEIEGSGSETVQVEFNRLMLTEEDVSHFLPPVTLH